MSNPDRTSLVSDIQHQVFAFCAMAVLGFRLPATMIHDVRHGRFTFNEQECLRLQKMLGDAECFRPGILSLSEMISERELWRSKSAELYFGKKHPSVFPGDIDPKKVVIIGGRARRSYCTGLPHACADGCLLRHL